MKCQAEKYITMHDLIMNGATYRNIADNLNVSKNTPCALVKRLKTTGSIFPSSTRASIYDPIIEEATRQIGIYALYQRRTYNSRKKQKLTSAEIYDLITADGYSLSKTKFTEILRRERNRIKESYLNILHIPGEKVQFDWGNILVRINNTNRMLVIAVFTLPFSNYRKAYVYEREDGYSFTHAFKQFIKDVNGVPSVLLTDNMKIARIISPKNYKEKILTSLFSDLSDHYDFEVEFCNPRRPNEKGSVENGVKVMKSELLSSYINSFNNLEEIQNFLNDTCTRLNNNKHHRKNDTCINLMKHEKACFKPLPEFDYVYYQKETRKVNNKGIISFKKNKYDVRQDFRGETVTVKYNKTNLYILSNNDDILAKYSLSGVKNKTYHRIWYCKKKLLEKPNGFIHSEEYKCLPTWIKIILHHACKADPVELGNLLYKLDKKPKDIISKLAKRKRIPIELLTLEQINIMLE